MEGIGKQPQLSYLTTKFQRNDKPWKLSQKQNQTKLKFEITKLKKGTREEHINLDILMKPNIVWVSQQSFDCFDTFVSQRKIDNPVRLQIGM